MASDWVTPTAAVEGEAKRSYEEASASSLPAFLRAGSRVTGMEAVVREGRAFAPHRAERDRAERDRAERRRRSDEFMDPS